MRVTLIGLCEFEQLSSFVDNVKFLIDSGMFIDNFELNHIKDSSGGFLYCINVDMIKDD